MEVEYEQEIECTCPKCGNVFKEKVSGTVEVEPPDRDEDG